MTRSEVERFFERMLAEPEETMDGSDSEARAALLKALMQSNASAEVDGDGLRARLAAYLEGALDPTETESFLAELMGTPDERYELDAAQSFLNELSEQKLTAPPELVAAATGRAARDAPRAAGRARGSWRTPLWSRQWALAGGSIAAMLLAVVVVGNRFGEISFAPVAIAPIAPVASGPQAAAPAQLAAKAPPPANANAITPPSFKLTVPAPVAPSVTIDVAQAPPPAATTAITNTPPRPPAPAVVARAQNQNSTPEQVVIIGSLIRGTAAVGVPVASLGEARSRQNTERYPNATPNPVKATAQEPVSTFSVDVDTASYANVRRYLTQGSLPPADAVRVEEMINYFDYHYAVPTDRSAPFQPTVAVYPTPWNPNTQILHIGIKGFDLPKAERPKANLVFLIDSSGSMNEPNKLPLLKRSFRQLVDQLGPEDRVAIVTYAGRAGVVLSPTPGSEKEKILQALDALNAAGSTAGGEGIRQAYQLAETNFDKSSVNRVILATDGDFNVGITDPNALHDFVARERSSGVFLTVLGFGVGNYNDVMMQKLAQAGNGVAAYIDTINEAHKVFVEQIAGTLFTIAKDVKIQVEFNPARVAEYRLIGYETRLLQTTDFNNDKVDAGDIGSGHTVTALYEITPVDSKAPLADPLRYGTGERARRLAEMQSLPTAGNIGNELAFVKIRYKLPMQDDSRLMTRPVTNADVQADFGNLPADLRFAAVVAGTGQLLRHDPYIKSFDYNRATMLAQDAKGEDAFGYRAEFIHLLDLARSAAALQPLERPNAVVGILPPPALPAATPAVALTSHLITDAEDYPAISQRLQEEGSVTIKYIVSENGMVSDCSVAKSSGKPRLDDGACAFAKRKWKFKPATQDGKPVASQLTSTVVFRLR